MVERYRPLRPGAQIAIAGGVKEGEGTIGCFVVQCLG
jgi:hypothetical protein